MKSLRRQAFTLVELLVVITIIGMLVALLLPAVNAAREAGRQTTCMNNQRNLGQAIQQYVTAKDYFPGYREKVSLANGNKIVANWQVVLLPNMGKTDVYQALQASGLSAYPYLDFFVCPSDNSIAGRSSNWTSYVANSGRLDTVVGTTGLGTVNVADPPTGTPVLESVVNGIFQDHILTPKSTISLSDIKDGQATTLMLAENADAGYYSDGPGSDTPSFIILNNNPAAQVLNARNCSERGAGFVWWDTSEVNTNNPPKAPAATPTYPVQAINGKVGDYDVTRTNWPTPIYNTNPPTSGVSSNYAARPASNHPSGVVVVFAGGNTKFVSEGIEYGIYCQLMTPTGAKSPTKSHDTATPQKSWQFYYPIPDGQF